MAKYSSRKFFVAIKPSAAEKDLSMIRLVSVRNEEAQIGIPSVELIKSLLINKMEPVKGKGWPKGNEGEVAD